MISIFSLLCVMVISLLVTRLAAMALTLTGMSQESARFQARSALSGVGFTTNESELVISHPVRRRVIMMLMLIGNIGVPTVMATLVVSLLSTRQAEAWWWPAMFLGGGIIGLIALSRSKFVERRLNVLLAWGLQRWTDLDVRDYVSLLQLQNGYGVTEMVVEPGDWLHGKNLQQAALSREGVLVLGIQHGDGSYIGTPRAEDVIRAGDTLVLYGQMQRTRELDQRLLATGEAAHQQAVKEYELSTQNARAQDQQPASPPENSGEKPQ